MQPLRHRRLLGSLLGAAVVFLILKQLWFYVMGTFAIIGAVCVVRQYQRPDRED